MGKIGQGILGGVSGKVGNVVGASWKGINYIRIKPDHVTNPQTEKQVKHRSRFKAIVEFTRALKSAIIDPIWKTKAVKMSASNLFVKTNMVAFNEDGTSIDYSQLQLAIGDLPLPADMTVADHSEEGKLQITWSNDSGQGSAKATDKLKLVLIANDSIKTAFDLNATRADESAIVVSPFGSGVDVNVYAFFASENKNCFSRDKYALVAVS